MTVALVHGRIGGEAIEITVTLRIPDKNAFAARQNDTEWLVVLGAKARFRREKLETGGPIFSSLPLQRTGTNWLLKSG
jgi:hypothetical protein